MPRSARRITALFLTVEGVLYLSFLGLDLLRAGGSTPIKYAAILLCLAYALWTALAWRGERLVCLALGLTVWADWYLLVREERYLLGVALFCTVQGCYLFRIVRANSGRGWWGVRGALAAGALAVLAGMEELTPLNALAGIYFTFFLCNVGQSLALKGRRLRLFALGLALFLCCDLWVGVFNAPFPVPVRLHDMARVEMWLFYLPAQVLIVLSALPEAWFGGAEIENQ